MMGRFVYNTGRKFCENQEEGAVEIEMLLRN